jgi:hypothetical protein
MLFGTALDMNYKITKNQAVQYFFEIKVNKYKSRFRERSYLCDQDANNTVFEIYIKPPHLTHRLLFNKISLNLSN